MLKEVLIGRSVRNTLKEIGPSMGATDQEWERWSVRMKRWTHPQDFIVLAAGVYALLAPIWTTTTDRATTTMIVLGALTAVIAGVELMKPDWLPAEGATALLGILFFISPWVMGFTAMTAMSWTAWIVGGVAFLIGAADMQITRSHHGEATTTPM